MIMIALVFFSADQPSVIRNAQLSGFVGGQQRFLGSYKFMRDIQIPIEAKADWPKTNLSFDNFIYEMIIVVLPCDIMHQIIAMSISFDIECI